MSVTFIEAIGANANATTIVVNKPASAQVGDVMLLAVIYRGNINLTAPGDMLTPNGISNPIQSGTASSDVRMNIRYHLITSGSPASWTFTQSSSARITARGALLRGVDPNAIINVAGGAGGSLTAPSVTTTGADAFMVYFGGYWSSAQTSTTFTPPAGMDERTDGGTLSSFGTVATEQLNAAGATGTRTATNTPAGGSLAAALVAVNSLSPPGNVQVWNGVTWSSVRKKQLRVGSVWQ